MARQKVQPPNLAYLVALKQELEDFYREQDAQIDRMRGWREMTQAVDVGMAKVSAIEHRDPSIADELQRVPAMFGVNPPACQVKPAKQTDKAIGNATLRERASEGILRQAGSREAGPTTYERAFDAACADGGAWTKLVFNKDLWDNRYSLRLKQFGGDPAAFEAATEDAKKDAGVPFEWVAVDARSIYPVFRGRTLYEVLEVQQRPFFSTLRQYRLALDARGEIVPEEMGAPDWELSKHARGVSMVEWVEHWTATHVTYSVVGGPRGGRRIVAQWEHGYGQVPYFPALPLVHNQWRNRKVGWSIAEPKRYLVELKSYYRTLLANVAVAQAIPTMFREVPADGTPVVGNDGAPLDKQTYEPGYVYNLRPGEKIQIPPYPPIAPALQAEIASIDKDLERMEPPRFNGEMGGGMSGAGFAVAQVLAENRTRWSPISAAVERMLHDVTRFMWRLIREKVKETVWVYRDGEKDAGWVGLGPEDLADPVALSWEVNPNLPSDDVLKERLWAARVSNGSASVDMMIEALGGNPDEVRRGRALDRIRQTPWYQSAEDAAVLAEIGRGDLLRMQQQAEQIAQQGIAGPVPGQPAEAAPGLVPDVGNLALAPGGQGAAPVAPAGQPRGVSPAGTFGPNVGQVNANAAKAQGVGV